MLPHCRFNKDFSSEFLVGYSEKKVKNPTMKNEGWNVKRPLVVITRAKLRIIL